MSTSITSRVVSLSFAAIAYIYPIATEAAPSTSTRDQGQIYSTDGTLNLGTDNWAQTITTGIAGQLASIQYQPDQPGFALLPAAFHFAIIGGGNPATGPILHSERVVLTLADVEPWGIFDWDLTSASLFFDVGEVFAFSIRAEQPGFTIAANDPPGYRGGELFRNGVAQPPIELNDIAFRTYVIPGPVSDPPTADAGPDQTVHAGTLVQFDGSNSSDDRTESGLLTYEWSILCVPVGSQAALSDPHSPAPTLLPDLSGYYVLQLIVTDEHGLASASDLMVFGVFNHAPTADAGADQTAFAGMQGTAVVTLDGSGSLDPDGDALDYAWYNDAGEQIATGAAPQVTLPTGSHLIELVVSDGLVDSDPDAVEITVVTQLEAEVRLIPGAMDLMHPPYQVTAIVTLPKGVSIDDLDPGEPWRLSPGDLEAIYTCRLFGSLWESAYGVRLYLVFDARQLTPMLWPGQVELSVYGRLKSGRVIGGTQSIAVTDSGADHAPLLITGGGTQGILEPLQSEPGELYLQGDRTIALPDGYIPAPGDTLRILDSGDGLAGTLDELEFPELPFGLRLVTDSLATSGELVVALETADTDLDGIGDGWEYQHFGGDCDPQGNPDGDPADNHSEYVAGSDPLDPTSHLRITSMRREAGGFTIEWEPCIAGRSYSVRWSENPAGGFLPLATGIEFPQESFTDTGHAGDRAAFYQVEVRMK